MAPMRITHYLPAYVEHNGRQQKAACGRWLARPTIADVSDEPTCPGCKAYVESEAATAHLTAEDVFGDGVPEGAALLQDDYRGGAR